MDPITVYDGCTLYDMIEKYDYTMAEIFGEYAVWDDEATTRETLNQMIYDYFANREIASETPEQFCRFAKIRITRLMLKVNTIAETVLDPDPLTWDITGQVNDVSTSSLSGTRTPNLTSTSESENKATALQSDTPQVQLSGTKNYMTALSESGGTGMSTAHETGTETTATSGSGTNARTLREGSLAQRAALWLEMQPDIFGFILDGLEPLFMQVWS